MSEQRSAAAATATAAAVVLDATDHVAGRFCSHVAKMLLDGRKVVVLNAEKAVLSGDRHSIVREWHKQLEIGSVTHPEHGPYHPRAPDRIITRMVRGMVPRRKPKGVSAMKRLRVYIGVPRDYEGVETGGFERAKIRRSVSYYTSMGDLAREIGWNG